MQVTTGTHFESRLKHPDRAIHESMHPVQEVETKVAGNKKDFNLFQKKFRVTRHSFC